MATVLDLRPAAPQPLRRAASRAAAYDVDILRLCLGLIIVGFGVLKFFPDVSPAQPLVTHAVDLLTFGLLSGQTAMVVTASVECFVGLILVSGRFLRFGLVLLAGCVLGWMSPLVLFPADLFTSHGPTLAAQYILKDIVLGAAALVIAAKAFSTSK
jgi:uncharacterized membrane protein YphA (DoxX/SURF4 family)